MSAVAWWTYFVYLKPSRDQRLVDDVTAILTSRPELAKWVTKSKAWSPERKLIYLSDVFRYVDYGVPPGIGIKASRAALDLAIHSGSEEARLVLGKSMRDGDYGEKDPKAALSQFQSALAALQPGIQTSDHGSLYVYSLMLKEGLGVESDPTRAREILQRVALSLDHATMDSIAGSITPDRENKLDIELLRDISLKLVREGFLEGWKHGYRSCLAQMPLVDPHMLDKMLIAHDSNNDKDFDELLKAQVREMRALNRHDRDCFHKFGSLAAEKGNKEAIAYLTRLPSDNSRNPDSSRDSPTLNALAIDPDAQSRTGYLKGAKQIAKGGLSTFKVDNTKGGGDAVVRLYRDGRKPAARSMFVKNGESFTAAAIAPGAYRLRYRYIGSGDTYEAEETFTLSETPTETGTRFSKMTVTLYKVANGNMTVKKVDANEF